MRRTGRARRFLGLPERAGLANQSIPPRVLRLLRTFAFLQLGSESRGQSMMIEKPLPLPTEDSEAYWESCHRGVLAIPRCRACDHRFLPPAPLCPVCWSEDVRLEPASGRARLYSWIVVHRSQHPAFNAEAPYLVAIVEMDEGPRMHTHLIDVDPAALA